MSENNYYLDQLAVAELAIGLSRVSLGGLLGTGNPASRVATHIATGGWKCDAGDEWVAELTERCKHIDTDFATAAGVIEAAKQGETETVDDGDPHGLAFKNSWGYRSAMSLRD